VTVELGDGIDPALNARVRALDRALANDPFEGFREAVPSYRALLVFYDPDRAGFSEVRETLLSRAAAPEEAPLGRLHEIPTRYGGDEGPDLADVARSRGLTEEQVIALHGSVEYTAFMLGFTPGFAYLGFLPEALETPRRATPRVRVRAGSVAIAGRQTAVYPVASPGGWHLLGRTSLRLFDPALDPPALIQAGDRVRFVPVAELPAPEPASPPFPPSGAAAIEVLDGGLLTTVQDGGRPGYRRFGVTAGGAMDAWSHRLANRLVGNADGAAVLECTVAGPILCFLRAVHFAVAGADLGPVLRRADLGDWPVPPATRVLARPGNVLAFTGRRAGCRAYLAIAGGIEVPLVLGSRSTDVAGGFGGLEGRTLRAGDLLALGEGPRRPGAETADAPIATGTPTLRVVLGPQDDHLTEASLAAFLAAPYAVLATSDRMGCRLSGPRLEHRGPAEIVTDGMAPGSIQVPPDGQPIVMMAEAPTTGGYPKLGTVIEADLPALAQVMPGEGDVRFAAVSVGEARRARR
jgi:KipI family sensor histidine kinase inhibitor